MVDEADCNVQVVATSLVIRVHANGEPCQRMFRSVRQSSALIVDSGSELAFRRWLNVQRLTLG